MKKNEKNIIDKAIEGAAAENISRFGSAIKEHLVALSGKDNSTGTELKRGLRSIAGSKVNSDFEKTNIKQQAGFSAEVKSVARKNALNIIEGKEKRYIRTDDIEGRVNDQLYDVVEIDKSGSEIVGSAAQMKFVGNSPDAMLDKFMSKDYRKYLENDAIMDIPDDYYTKLMGDGTTQGIIDRRMEELYKQIECLKQEEKVDEVAKAESKLSDYEKIKKNLRKSGLTNDEAIEARQNPFFSTAKDVVKLANKAGVEQAKIGAGVAGSISIIKNFVACAKGEIEPNEAGTNVIKDTGYGAAISYATAFSGTMINGIMQNSTDEYVRSLAKTNLASGIVITTKDVSKTMVKYIRGDISGVQCVEELGKQGIGELGATMYSTIAVASVSSVQSVGIKVLAGIVGSTLGYMAAVAIYEELAKSLEDYELSKFERNRIESECEEAVKLISQYRIEMNESVEKYLSDRLDVFVNAFTAMDNSIACDDINGYLTANASIQEVLGKTPQFRTKEEFEELMLSDEAIVF